MLVGYEFQSARVLVSFFRGHTLYRFVGNRTRRSLIIRSDVLFSIVRWCGVVTRV